MIPEELLPAMQGAIPSVLVTCHADGEPNTTAISQCFYVDQDHVALSFQFFNKTIKNVRSNPKASLQLFNPVNFDIWNLEIEYDHSEMEGDTFDQMDMQMEAIASMTGMSDVFKLHAADIYKVKSLRKLTEMKN
jgi:uncharacterized protein